MYRHKYLLCLPSALLEMLERAHAGENPEDLMFEILDTAAPAFEEEDG